MDNATFLESLDKKDLSKQEKIDVCQFFIESYPVKTRLQGWTKLQGISILGGMEAVVNQAFNSLSERKEELAKFGNRDI